jgi:hypothetical protein
VSRRAVAVAVAFGLVGVLGPRAARACGVSSPGGPMMCSFDDAPKHRRAGAGPLRLGASYGYTTTTILFGDGRRAASERHTAFALLETRLSRQATFHVGAGPVLGGALVTPATRHVVGPGLVAAIGAGVRALDGQGMKPLLTVSATMSYLAATTHDERDNHPIGYRAGDLRLGILCGKTILDTVTPYATARVFGGPIWWRFEGQPARGTDLYKYQIGGGVSVTPVRGLDAFAEGIAAGERGVVVGAGARL